MVGAIDDSDLSKEKITKIFEQMDANNDEKLSREEFIEGAKQDETFVSMLQARSSKK